MLLAKAPLIWNNAPKSLANPRNDRWASDSVKRSMICAGNCGNFKTILICNANSSNRELVVEEPRPVAFKIREGKPQPFGATACDGGVNFAIFSKGTSSATLCLFTVSDLEANKVAEQIPLDPLINKTGDVWHIFLEGDINSMLYGYKFDGNFCPEEGHYFGDSRVLLDPYAKAVISRGEYGVLGPDGNCWPQMAGTMLLSVNEFDWEGDLPLRYPQKDLIIYEMHVRGYTKHESSKTEFPGTYLGVVEKLDHFKELGINCLELMPCHEFNEMEYFNNKRMQGEGRYV